MKKIITLLLTLFISLSAKESEETPYTLGEGLQVASLPLYLGGYFSLDYKRKPNEEKYEIEDFAILGYGSYEKISYITELEFKKLYVNANKNEERSVEQDTALHVERLYSTYNVNENYDLGVGKYNSPIGYWNLIPVNVLRDTSSIPITSFIIFPQYTTGVNASYNSYTDNDFRIDVMLQKNSDIDPKYNNYEINEHYGIGFTYAKNNFSLKFNAGVFQIVDYYNEDDEFNGKEHDGGDGDGDEDDIDKDFETLTSSKHYYALLSAKYDSDSFQVMGEIGSQRSKDDFITKYAGYVQSVYRFDEKHMAILRAESYDNQVSKIAENMAIVGYTYRPIYPIAIKTEYQFHSISNNDTLLLSFSMMF